MSTSGTPGSPARDQQLSSRDRMLLAAKTLFARDGYENTSTVAIARLAGTSESQLMKHFGSKEGLLEAIFDTGWNHIGSQFHLLERTQSPAEKLEVLLELMLGGMERDQEMRELMLLEGRRIRKEGHMVMLTQGYRNFVAVVDSILGEMRQRGQLRDDISVEAVRSGLVAMLEGMLRDQVLAKRVGYAASFDTNHIRKIFKLVLAAFIQPQPAAESHPRGS